MIRVSAKAEYAARAVLQLAMGAGSKPLQLAQIAQAQKVPREFLVQVMADLVRAGLVSSRRGAKGGYKLRVRPEEIHLKQVIEAVDGSIGEFSCKEGLSQCMGPNCIFRPIWGQVVGDVGNKLAEFNFRRLSDSAAQAGGGDPA